MTGLYLMIKKSCLQYEAYLNKINQIMSRLKEKKEGYGYAVKQDMKIVKTAMRDFFDQVAKNLVDWDLAKRMMDDTVNGIRDMSHISRIFSEYPEFPLLSKTFFRFECIDFESGVEYDQPYFASHKSSFNGIIE